MSRLFDTLHLPVFVTLSGCLNCVMYRIIERGGNRIGPRRGFLFAKEFGRNIDIPMIFLKIVFQVFPIFSIDIKTFKIIEN